MRHASKEGSGLFFGNTDVFHLLRFVQHAYIWSSAMPSLTLSFSDGGNVPEVRVAPFFVLEWEILDYRKRTDSQRCRRHMPIRYAIVGTECSINYPRRQYDIKPWLNTFNSKFDKISQLRETRLVYRRSLACTSTSRPLLKQLVTHLV